LFSGEPAISEESTDVARATTVSTSLADRVTTLEAEVARLREELSEVQQQLAAFRKQFE
jgi:uncharacterized protein YceH (UPF0502 family)